MPKDEFLNLLHYVSGIVGSDTYNDKSLVHDQRDEERLSTYIEELSIIYRDNVKDKTATRLETEKVFGQLKDEISPHAAQFRKPANLFRTMASIGHLVTLPQSAIDQVKSKPIELKGLGSLADFISVIKGSSIKDSLKTYQAYLGKLSRMEKLSSYTGLSSFLLAVNQAPDAEVIAKEINDIFKKLEHALSDLAFSSLLHMAQISSKLNKGVISRNLLQTLDTKAKAEMDHFDRNDYYQYFSLARYSGGIPKEVIFNFIDRKAKNKDLELSSDATSELMRVYQAMANRSESIDLLLAEFEADMAHLAHQLNDPLNMTAAMRRLNN